MVFDNSAWTLSQIRILNANMVCVRALCVFFSICFCFVWVIFFLCLSFQSKAFLLFSWCVLRFRFLCKYFMSNIHRLGFSQRQDTQMNEKTSTNFKMNTNQIINLHRRSQTNVYTQTPLKFCYYYYYYYFQFNEAGFPLKFAFFFSLSPFGVSFSIDGFTICQRIFQFCLSFLFHNFLRTTATAADAEGSR